MRQTGSIRPELGPAAAFAYTLGDSLLAARLADMDPNPNAYHAVCNHFLGVLAAEEIGYYTPEWEQWQREAFKGADGLPLRDGSPLTKWHRRQEMARAVGILRRKGILGRADKDFSRDEGILAEAMEDDD